MTCFVFVKNLTAADPSEGLKCKILVSDRLPCLMSTLTHFWCVGVLFSTKKHPRTKDLLVRFISSMTSVYQIFDWIVVPNLCFFCPPIPSPSMMDFCVTWDFPICSQKIFGSVHQRREWWYLLCQESPVLQSCLGTSKFIFMIAKEIFTGIN